MRAEPASFSVVPGAEVFLDGRRGTITRIVDLDTVLVRDAESGEVRNVTVTELEAIASPSSADASPTSLEAVSESDWRVAQRRL